MLKYTIHKLAFTILVLIGAATCSFLLLHAIPGDAALTMAGPSAAQEDIENLRRAMGLDRPLIVQYGTYMNDLLHGNLGYSFRSNLPVWDLLSVAWVNTMKLSVTSMLLAILLGVPIGIYAAVKRGTIGDTIAMVLTFIGVSMPSFWLALLLIILFSVKLGWFPFYGITGINSYILPSLTLGLGVAANIARLTRASMLEILGQDYIRTAYGKGLRRGKVIGMHALRNAAVPIVTIIGLQFSILLGGQVVTETIFSWPGVGRMIVDSFSARDIQIVQSGILIIAFTFTIINLLTDLLYGILDPRIRY